MIIIFLIIDIIKRKLAQSLQTVKDRSEQESDIPSSPTREDETAFNFADNCCYASAGILMYDVIHSSADSVDKQTTTMVSRNFDTLTVDVYSCAKDLEHEGSA